MAEYRPLEYQSFVLRFWRESASGTWRGQVLHLPDQETASFASWDQALAFVSRFVRLAGFEKLAGDPPAPEGEP